ncbi:MAG: serine O-acetyltransferase [Clostridiales bacterium]|nr:serine O-acetyltransferase [Clostridiales bacterium]
MRKESKLDLQAALEKDPAATSKFLIKHTYSGFIALKRHRLAHRLYLKGFHTLAMLIAYRTKRKTGIEIHPAAKIGSGVFIDHGAGVVIGETAEVGNNVVIYQGVTLGGTGKDTGKRHPTIEDDVMISAGAKVLGPVRIGRGSKIGAGSVVIKDVPPYSTVVGVPGRIVKQNGARVADLNQILLPDPIMEEFKRINARLFELEKRLGVQSCRYSLTVDEANVKIETNEKTETDTKGE